ncbi:hypothetical protein [Oceanomicrobium pacificus]|uniref:Uncharacterized protein n=1 Tax=Oceanomicrobium pacificus TaxID=2692916 RepID=A0A6B0TPV7_9RHOB|nr:hypothetical protein [Oceanomicrobium pacificus]MXU65966.1 hypothetical protein [Oceanomicrobium pacificus]
MKTIVKLVACVVAVSVPFAGIAQDIKPGTRITVTSDWHAKNGGPYSPNIVSCNSNSGLCLKDTGTSAQVNAMTKTAKGLQVVFKDYGVVYMFRPGGKGTFHDMNGKQTGTFAWVQ